MLDQTDDGEHEQEDADRPAAGEAGAERVQDLQGGHAAEEAGHQAGDGDHEHGVEPQREADDHHEDAEEDEHALRLSRGGRGGDGCPGVVLRKPCYVT